MYTVVQDMIETYKIFHGIYDTALSPLLPLSWFCYKG